MTDFQSLGYSAMTMFQKPNDTCSGSSRLDLSDAALLGTDTWSSRAVKIGAGGVLPCVVSGAPVSQYTHTPLFGSYLFVKSLSV